MNNNKSYNTIYLITGIIFIGVISRLIPNNIPNFSAIGAVALFAGRYIKNIQLRYIIPITAMCISDLLLSFSGIGLANPIVHTSVYGSFALTVLLGAVDSKKLSKFVSIPIASVFAALVFFIITNFAVWLNGWYGYTLEGLLTCYTVAIPYFGNTILGNLTYSAILFGSYEFFKLKYTTLVTR